EAPRSTTIARRSIKSCFCIRIQMVLKTPLTDSPHGATQLGFIADRSQGSRFCDAFSLERFDRRLQKRNGGRIRSAGDILINVLQLASGDPVAHGSGIFDVLYQQMQASVSRFDQLLAKDSR